MTKQPASRHIRSIQNALVLKGFVLGQIDGVLGRRTIAAIKAFQERNGLLPDGIVGSKTAKVLFADVTSRPEGTLLPWMAEAEHLMGTREVVGPNRNNPIILDWADDLDLHYPGDEIPWCGLFVAHCIGTTMPGEPLPSNPLRARDWERFGDSTEPRLGAILCFWRGSKASGLGHVGFYNAETDDSYRVLGGNQSNSVCLAWVAKNRLTKARWPRMAASLGGGESIVRIDREESLSVDEV